MGYLTLISLATGVLFAASAPLLADASKPAAGDSFQVESVTHPGRLLRVEDARSADGTPIVLYSRQAWRCMTWELEADGAGFRLKNHFTHKTFVPKTPAEANTPLVQKSLAKEPSESEAWKFAPIDGKEGLFRIVHVSSGLAIEANEDQTIVARSPSDAAGQQWRLLAKPEKFTG